MKLLIIYNPHAGNGRAKDLLPQVSAYLKEKQLDADIRLTERMGHAIDIVAEADLSQYQGVIASGGDGTQFEVVNGYFKNKAKVKPPIGLIPNGTGNAFMKELKLVKSDWKRAIDIIAKNHTKKIDVGHFTTQGESYHFLNIVGMGFVTKVAEASIPLKWMGNSAYTLATLLKLVNLKSHPTKIEIDGNTIERDAVFVMVANSTFTGTSFFIAPKAKLDDGLLDVVILNKISRLRLLRLFTSIYDGSHINYPEIEYIQAQKVKVIDNTGGKLIPDGEILGSTPVELECLPEKIQFLWDPEL